jgi:NDP-sugar pyrophosphorylase family protein
MISRYLSDFHTHFADLGDDLPWNITALTSAIILKKISTLSNDFKVVNNVAIHKKATVEEHAIVKGPAIISEGCFIGSHAYFRGGVFLAEHVTVGPGCEVKSCIIMPHAALAHFNFVGDSLVGSYVNMEAGSIVANHFNERDNKEIQVLMQGHPHRTGVTKFGALIGDQTKIGANAVLSPGTILPPKSIVKRLELVEQVLYLS